MRQHSQPSEITDDGLLADEIGGWSEEKHRILAMYAKLFSTSMKNKWPIRTYVDLFAGAGRSHVKGSPQIALGSPLIALDLPDTFTHYVFCEKDPVKMAVLKQRVAQHKMRNAVTLLNVDVNKDVGMVGNHIDRNGLTLCFVDPYKISDLQFATINSLAQGHVDFIMLLALYMDVRRNYDNYIRPQDTTIDGFLGLKDWRVDWQQEDHRGKPFTLFLLEKFAQRMEGLGFLQQPAHETRLIQLPGKNVSLYRLAFFSRSFLAQGFWKEVMKYTSSQQELDLPL